MVLVCFCVKRLLIFPCFVAVYAVAARPSSAGETKPETMPRGVTAQDVVKILESCPAWSDTNTRTNDMLACLKLLSNCDTAVLRAGLVQFVEKCQSEKQYTIDNMSKLFILNRLVFAVPEGEKFSGPFFGGWEGVPHAGHEMNMLWPLALRKDGELILVGKYSGYTGHRHLAVEEFDHFLAKYGRRQTPPSNSPKSIWPPVPPEPPRAQ